MTPQIPGQGTLHRQVIYAKGNRDMEEQTGPLNNAQRKKLSEMLQLALADVRIFSLTGQDEQASDLADAFHTLPLDLWREDFDLWFFREAFIYPYTRKWGNDPDYLRMLEEVSALRSMMSTEVR